MPNQTGLPFSRRGFMGRSLAAGVACSLGTSRPALAEPGNDKPLEIGSRRELFLDDFLVDRLSGKAEFRLHHPEPREVVLVHDAPWEGSGSGYHSVFQDGPLYRMYYKAWQLDVASATVRTDAHPLYCCYAESDDGIHWRKPALGLVDFRGSKANNIVIASGKRGPLQVDAGHPAVFKDDNPDAASDARYKAFVRSATPNGLLPFKSADGLRWSPMTDHPVITAGAFDSQNLAFWDAVRGEYRAFWRYFTAAGKGRSVRAVRTATSKNFLDWSEPLDLRYVDSPAEEMYTNQVKPYVRAPHLLIGFPTRYTDRGWSPSMKALPERDHREARARAVGRYGTAVTDALVMVSRDGRTFRRWNESFLRPGIEREGTWNYGQQYIAWHLVETRSALEGAPNELSLYATESYWTGSSSALRRYTLRMDGFVSLSAPMSGGTLVTKPLRFAGNRLRLNISTSAAGSLRVEIQDAGGQPHSGFAAEDCDEVFGDALDREVSWKGSPDIGALAGMPVRLRISLRDADLYALRFATGSI